MANKDSTSGLCTGITVLRCTCLKLGPQNYPWAVFFILANGRFCRGDQKQGSGAVQQTHAGITTAQVKAAATQGRVQQQKSWTSGFVSGNPLLGVGRNTFPSGRLDKLSIKFWVVAIAGANVPILGPLLFLGPSAKTAPSRKAVLFNGQILTEAEPGLIWTDQT